MNKNLYKEDNKFLVRKFCNIDFEFNYVKYCKISVKDTLYPVQYVQANNHCLQIFHDLILIHEFEDLHTDSHRYFQ